MAKTFAVRRMVVPVASILFKTVPYHKTETVKAARKRTISETETADVNGLSYVNGLRRALRVARFADKSAEVRKAMVAKMNRGAGRNKAGRTPYEEQVHKALTAYKTALTAYGLTDATGRAYGRATGSFSKDAK